MDWARLTRDALLGAGRGGQPPAAAPPIEAFLEQVEPGAQAGRLLLAAAVQDLFEQASQLPAELPDGFEPYPAPVDDRLELPPAVTAYLERLLNGQHRDCLPEFLAALQRINSRIPDLILPNLLLHGARFARQQADISPVVGPRGRWLARFHPRWQYAAVAAADWDDLAARWRGSSLRERTQLLEQIRGQEPRVGRELLATTWRQEPDNNRIHLLRQMAIGLSMDDEPFLETALDDRSQPVRRLAIEQLQTLPESRFAARMSQYLTGIVHWSPAHRHKITVTFPPEPTAAMLRDGILPRGKRTLSNYISQQLILIVGSAPLAFWSERWRKTPEQIVRAVQASGWTRTLTLGLANAAYRQKAIEWARTLLVLDEFSSRTQRLVGALPPEEAEALIDRVMDNWELAPFNQSNPLRVLWREWPGPWSAGLSRRWAAVMARHIAQDTQSRAADVSLRSIFLKFTLNCPPEIFGDLEHALLPALETGPIWQPTVEEALDRVRFRRELQQALEKI